MKPEQLRALIKLKPELLTKPEQLRALIKLKPELLTWPIPTAATFIKQIKPHLNEYITQKESEVIYGGS
ncbi:MAG: hypothetical protein JRI85_17680 [Deltaproteobacteria bacterium]|nr:hypothetical protein [Deltaproteobacteria bacterium]